MLLQDSRRPPASARTGSSSCSRTRTARSGTGLASTRGSASSTVPSRSAGRGRTSSRPQSRPRTPRIARARRSSLLYDALAAMDPSPVVRLNRAVAVALAGDVEQRSGARSTRSMCSTSYHLLHAARADLCRRLGRRDEAAAAYRRALALTANETETPVPRAAPSRGLVGRARRPPRGSPPGELRRPQGSLECHDSPAEPEPERHLRGRAPAPADGDHRVTRRGHCEVPRMARCR